MASSSSSQPQVVIITCSEHVDHNESNLSQYLPLYKAALRGDWKRASSFFPSNRLDAVTSRITPNGETALHVAVGTGKANHFVSRLVDMMEENQLAQRNRDGDTALSIAAIVGNIGAAKMLLKKAPNLFQIANIYGRVPLLEAARYGQKKMVLYLLDVGKQALEMEPYADKPCVFLLNLLIIAGFLDVALNLIQENPRLNMAEFYGGESILSAIAGKPSAFPSGTSLGFWQRIIYYGTPPKYTTDDWMSNLRLTFRITYLVPLVFYAILWEILTLLAPPVKRIQDTKLMHRQALELVKHLCKVFTREDYRRASSLLKRPLLLAAQLGIHEVVEEIVVSFPHAIWFSDEHNHNIFQLAVMNRREKVFNLIYQMTEYKHMVTVHQDTSGNNILHLAGKLAPSHQLNLKSGAALQMQHELQWFKEVEKFVQPAYKEDKNSERKTPVMVFTEEHKDLVKEGEKWMKDTANSCIFVAALIAAISFAAAITVPGGSDQNKGIPIFTKERAFVVFGFSDALSLFTSASSLSMFLSILTSRYAEEDFLFSLPNRLICGLVTLFLSIIFMMIAFGASLYLVFGNKHPGVLASVVSLACVPVTLFGSLQFSLLTDMIMYTYGCSIFRKQSKRKLH